MNPSTNCPYCGAEETELLGLRYPSCRKFDDYGYILGDDDRTDLCREREARQKAESQVKELKENAERIGCNRFERLCKAESEVARLRELLTRAIEIAERLVNGACGEWGCIGHTDEVDKYGKELTTMKAEARLAPAPEEPVPEKPTIAKSATVEPVSAPNELKNQNKENTHSLSRWRHLGHHETICEGDEYYSYGHGRFMTLEKGHPHIGAKPSEKHYVKFRTRRALQKQDEMPLEKELERLKDRGWTIDPIPDIRVCLEYLRDEIQKLKKLLTK